MRARDQRPRADRVAVELLLRHAEIHRQRDEPRLGAVVEVALDPLQLGGLGVDGARARALQLDDAPPLARGQQHAPEPRQAEPERRASAAR